MSHLEEITDLIEAGTCDAYLDLIIDAAQQRKRVVAQILFAELKVGDKVRVIEGVKQRYLVGATGEVAEKNVTRVVVQWPDDMGPHDPYRKRAGQRSVVPMSIIEKVQD